MATELAGFTTTTFTHDGKERTVYRAGTGPAVIVIAELPGITPPVADFARRLAGEGFTAVMPVLFGAPGKPRTGGQLARSFAQVCISREFRLLATRKNSPVTEWLRALARHEHGVCGGPGVGVVGMCLTGGFALAMAVDDAVLAPVLSQPSLPLPYGAARKADIGVDDDTLRRVKERCATQDLRLLGLRFTGDVLVPAERFSRLRIELGEAFVGVEIDSTDTNEFDIAPRAHSVLTEDLVDRPGHPTHEALQQVIAHFRDRLLAPTP
jgi:dienelactone hydrolase